MIIHLVHYTKPEITDDNKFTGFEEHFYEVYEDKSVANTRAKELCRHLYISSCQVGELEVLSTPPQPTPPPTKPRTRRSTNVKS